ncbi:TPA: DUF502 domain-containing protein [Legionella pneumophila]|nr:DUF502 domain-containing protein [Legionella pneumophila]HEO1402911.1 DUF502 domain-containing protein [Legionella pneumophila]
MKSKSIRSYLFAGLVVWLPILVTLVILRFIVDLLDQTIALLPKAYQPAQLLGFHLPGLGVVLSLILLIITGLFATNFLGQRLVSWSESILDRIPLVRSIYNATKQVINTILSTNSQAFRKVLLVEYPRKGLWSLAFQTGITAQEINQHTGTEMLSIFVPTTPNPTSGFLMVVPKSDVIELSMTIDEALKFIITLGVLLKK